MITANKKTGKRNRHIKSDKVTSSFAAKYQSQANFPIITFQFIIIFQYQPVKEHPWFVE